MLSNSLNPHVDDASDGDCVGERITARINQFWHYITLGMFALFLGTALWEARANLGLQHILLVITVVAQVGFYLQAFVWQFARQRAWPGQRRWFVLHFLIGLALVLVSQRIAPSMLFLGWMYFGHGYSLVMPPRFTVPYMALVVFGFMGFALDWNLARMLNPGTFVGFLFTYLGSCVSYLSINSASHQNKQRAELIQQLRAANTKLEAARLRETELATLRERERIARDMHDNLGHTLVAMTVQLEAIQRLYKVDAQRGDAQVAQLKQLTRESMAALRRSLDGLRAPGLGERGLLQAMHQLCVAVGQRSSLNVQCRVDEAASDLRHELADALWGVTQEALTNIEKHAKAKYAEVQLRVSADVVHLQICDDGIGIDHHVVSASGHYGLLGMRERVESLGGALSIQNNSGTQITATVPKG